jgi:PDDEXK-like domain of unknown function (DUF3799)
MSFVNATIVAKGVNPDHYHEHGALRGSKDLGMSSSSVREFYWCPDRWVKGYTPPATEAKDWGSLVDCLLLTPQDFPNRYAVKPATYPAPATHDKVKKGKIHAGDPLPWNANASICSAWEELQVAAGKTLISATEYGNATAALDELAKREVIRNFIAASDTQVWLNAEWKDVGTGLLVPVQCLIDLAPRADTEFADCLGDAKTTRNGQQRVWRRFCIQSGYHIQAAWDIDLWNLATGEQRETWCFILQENFPPWQPARRMLTQKALQAGRNAYRQMMSFYCRCLAAGEWPDYDANENAVQGWGLVDIEDREIESAMLAQEYRLATEAEEENPEPEWAAEPADVPTP